MNKTSATIELYGGRKLHEYYNPTTWNDFFDIVKKLKYADNVHLICHIGVIQLMELSDYMKSIIDLECDSLEFIILDGEQHPGLLFERFKSHVQGELECAKIIVKNFTNSRFKNYNKTKLLRTFDKNSWKDIEQIKQLISQLEELFCHSVIDSDKYWKRFTSNLVKDIDTKNINDYINTYKLVGGELFSNV